MNTLRCRLRTAAVGSLAATAVLIAGSATAQETATELRPNLKPRPASDIILLTDALGRSTLRYSTTSWNSGAGPLQLEAGAVDPVTNTQSVFQRVFLNDASSFVHWVGTFVWDGDHHHFHFNDYALATLVPVLAPGGTKRTGSKTSFCIMDTTPIDLSLPGAAGAPGYNFCGNTIQGMSIGWGDTYYRNLPGQEIDFTGNADGIYRLMIEIDPNQALIESDKRDNTSCVLLKIVKPNRIKVLDGSGNCGGVKLSFTAGTTQR